MIRLRTTILNAIALAALAAGVGGAIARGFSGVSQGCHEWVSGHGYQLVHDEWWAKYRGCLAKTPAGDEVYHSEELSAKAVGWAWQLAIFALGTVPAVTIVTVVALRSRRGSPDRDP